MKLSLIACPQLRPYIEHLLPESPHQIDVVYMPDQMCSDPAVLQETLSQLSGCDAVIITGGAASVPEDGLTAEHTQLVIPRVHNCASLLLGGAVPYRRLFEKFDGRICWSFPESEAALFSAPPMDCECLCYIVDTYLGLHDTGLSARSKAQAHGLDYFETEGDPSLLAKLMNGQWEDSSIIIVSKDTSIFPTYRSDLLD